MAGIIHEIETDTAPSPDRSALERVSETLRRCIATLSSAQLTETAALLRMAHLDLLSRTHDISSEELDALAGLISAER